MPANSIVVPGAPRAIFPQDVESVLAVTTPGGNFLVIFFKTGEKIIINDTPEARAVLRGAGIKIYTIQQGPLFPREKEIPIDPEPGSSPSARDSRSRSHP